MEGIIKRGLLLITYGLIALIANVLFILLILSGS